MKNVKNIINKAYLIKSKMKEDIAAVKANIDWSDSKKAAEIEKIRDAAKSELNAMTGECDKAFSDLKAKAAPVDSFDVTSSDFLNVIGMISACGENLPESAGKSIIERYGKSMTAMSIIENAAQKNKCAYLKIDAGQRKTALADKAKGIHNLADKFYYELVNVDAETNPVTWGIELDSRFGDVDAAQGE